MNAYELACERMELARRNCAKARQAVAAASAEFDAAEDNLVRHEVRPGIPLPQYRATVREDT